MINRKKCIDKMADRIPLIVNASAKQIQELPNQDDLVLSGQLKLTGTALGSSDILMSGGSDAKAVITLRGTANNLSQLNIACRDHNDSADVPVAEFNVKGTNDDVEFVSKGDIITTVPSGRTPIVSNTPAFRAQLSADQTITPNVGNTVNSQKVQFATEVFDSDGCYNNAGSTVGGVPSYSFKPNVAGFYFVFASTSIESSGNHVTFARVQILKNTAISAACVTETNTGQNGNDKEFTQTASTIVEMNGTSDTLHVQTDVTTDGSGSLKLNNTNTARNYFFAYKLII